MRLAARRLLGSDVTFAVAASTLAVTAISHTYRSSGAFTVPTTIKDAGGAMTSVSTTALVRN